MLYWKLNRKLPAVASPTGKILNHENSLSNIATVSFKKVVVTILKLDNQKHYNYELFKPILHVI